MNGRGLGSGPLRLIAMAAVALGIALFAGVSGARALSTLSDASQPVVVISDDGSGAASGATLPGQVAPLEVIWN